MTSLPGTAAPVSEKEKVQISISEALGGHRNSLGLIRLILASVVIFDHAFPLGGYGADPFFRLTRDQASLGSLAVAGFFAISGYLIAKSGMSSDVVQFLWRRVLRIFPAYWTVLLLTALVIAPIVWVTTGHAISNYFTLAPNNPLNYFTANWTLNIGTYGIYDIFATTTPYGREVGASVFNGSIWTLIYEWQCYLLIGAGVAFGVFYKAKILVPIVTMLLFVIQIVNVTNPSGLAAIAPYLSDTQRITLTFTFMLGASIAVYSKKIVYGNGLGILSGLVLLLSLRYGGFMTIGVIAGTYFVLYLAASLPRQVQWVGSKNDYSYGVYIYGFLVQQVTAHLGWYKFGYFPYALIALVLTFGCAWLSWHLVEKRAMALKDWGPGRGWSHWFDKARSLRPLRTAQPVPVTSTVAPVPVVSQMKED
ncbi:acyltransferase [Cryobacterium sp. TmT2-59]|uniref:Acyltransferase n=1 Tax=Cryobacterium shii TaxID=1259235 RepID=A0AAQ2C565_9MICO|nr:acyltransferase [Cryobacterium shii]TFC89636.1 acyltransferase [Cryobacterium sp. TmT2-59]TFD11978.1 acyltransferase [Cryobacterium sp. TMT4-10]